MAAVNATGTLTVTSNPLAAETVTIGSIVYTFRASIGAPANEVLIGGTVAATLQNLFDAINRTGTPGTQYSTATVLNTIVRASAVTATTVVVQSQVPGVAQNHVPTTETIVTGGAWGAATLTGGTGDAAADIRDILNTMQMPANVSQALRELAFNPSAV